MSRYLLDTSILIELARRREPAYSLVRALIAHDDEIGVCPVIVAEFYAGVADHQLKQADAMFVDLSFWEISRATAIRAGRYRYDLARRGIAVSTADTLIAAVAKEQQAVLATINVRDFPMTDIVIMPVGPYRT